ncbi:MAG: hypothetical protein WDZ30_11280 [Cellvibrionaceae bacterium]
MANKLFGNMDQTEREFFGSRDDRPEDRTPTSRSQIRDQVSDAIQAYLSEGGRINEIEPNVMADPPRKPATSYGSRPI